jgi:hypothetical protein
MFKISIESVAETPEDALAHILRVCAVALSDGNFSNASSATSSSITGGAELKVEEIKPREK